MIRVKGKDKYNSSVNGRVRVCVAGEGVGVGLG